MGQKENQKRKKYENVVGKERQKKKGGGGYLKITFEDFKD